MGGASKLLVLLSTPFPRLYPRSSLFRVARRSQVPLTSLPAVAGPQHRVPSSSYHPRRGFLLRAAEQMHTQASIRVDRGESSLSPPPSHSASFHQWPEWLKLVEHLTAGGYVGRPVCPARGDDHDDSFSVPGELPPDFGKLTNACLLYARERPDLLRSLSKKDIEAVVENGSPFLFKNALNSVRRMKSFIGSEASDVLQTEQACTIDVMRYLLSYACNSLTSTGGDETRCSGLVESSVRNLLCELVKISEGSNFIDSTAQHGTFGFQQSPKPLRQNVEMKRGDWICPKCNFMNFARNMKCLECDEARPKRQLSSGEWECPQCNFFNYGRNMTCLRCDCKCPGEISSSRKPSIEQLLNSGNTDRAEIERRLAENDEKAERWFSKVSQLDDSSDLSSAIADEDFPEIMPLRKGTNRFVISNRKTPLERRLADVQYRRNLGNEASYMGNDSPGRIGSDKMSEPAISQTLDRIFGSSSATSGTNSTAASETSKDTGHQLVSGKPSAIQCDFTSPQRRDSGSGSFVPLPGDMFHKKPSTEVQRTSDKVDFATVKADKLREGVPRVSGSGKANESLRSGDFYNLSGSETVTDQSLSKTVKDSSVLTERWSRRSVQLPDVANLQSATLNNDIPKNMPMHEQESRFDISNERENSVASPHYKRRIAMDQADNSNFVPFVPFPPDYFARKDKQPEAGSSTGKSVPEVSASVAVGNDKSTPQKIEENKFGYYNLGGGSNIGQTGGGTWNRGFSGTNLDQRKVAQQTNNEWNNNPASPSAAFPREISADAASGSGNLNRQVENPQRMTESWNRGFSGKSLEGSAVTEPDPLDMSEEAKAQRWFRRVAQIKDISELSKIPDEDFPEIMPMRKGVNRFVVSKRKTPLERRLTSPQYRRNLPIVSSEPGKDSSQD
uniref:Zinc finger protein VAR3, chloroplastic n=1 Tax=Anthurium amnicola TaxID=1678845 RepID=A0A1D1YGD3_9ARAE